MRHYADTDHPHGVYQPSQTSATAAFMCADVLIGMGKGTASPKARGGNDCGSCSSAPRGPAVQETHLLGWWSGLPHH